MLHHAKFNLQELIQEEQDLGNHPRAKNRFSSTFFFADKFPSRRTFPLINIDGKLFYKRYTAFPSTYPPKVQRIEINPNLFFTRLFVDAWDGIQTLIPNRYSTNLPPYDMQVSTKGWREAKGEGVPWKLERNLSIEIDFFPPIFPSEFFATADRFFFLFFSPSAN